MVEPAFGQEDAMARPIWKGAIAFGLVSIPVGLQSAVQEQRPRFNQLQRGSSNRIRYKRVNESTGEEVPYEEIVRGVEVGRGRYVVLDDDELKSAAPRASRTIDLLDFVEAAEIDPVYYDTPYYLVPDGEAARRPYALLVAALQKAERVGIATFVLREREHLCALRAKGSLLVLETMRFADEVRPVPGELSGIEELTPRGRELEVAVSLVESLASPFQPERYRDEYRQRIDELVAAKERGEEIVVEEPVGEESAQVIDLVSVLARSVADARRRRGGATDDAGGAGPKAAESDRKASRRGTARERSAGEERLEELSRSELYERARRLDIPNRSAMNRDELIQALRAAGRASGGHGRRAS